MEKKFFVTCLLFLSAFTGLAADFNMWVGESGTYDLSSLARGFYNLRVSRVSCAQPSVYCNTLSTMAVKWSIEKYYSGTATIVVEYDYQVSRQDSYKRDRINITVSCKDNQVTVEPSRLTLKPGEYYNLSYSFQSPSHVSSLERSWTTDDRSGKIITVDNYGRVKAIGPGVATVYFDHNQGSNRGTCVVNVEDLNPDRVILPANLSISVGESQRLIPQLEPSNSSTSYTWWSDNSSIASVYDGEVTGVGVGKTKIYVRTANQKEANCEVTVKKPSFKVSSSTPTNSASNVSVLTKPSVLFTSQPKWASGKSGHDVVLSNVNKNVKVTGTVTLSGNTLVFSPQKALDPQTRYRL